MSCHSRQKNSLCAHCAPTACPKCARSVPTMCPHYYGVYILENRPFLLQKPLFNALKTAQIAKKPPLGRLGIVNFSKIANSRFFQIITYQKHEKSLFLFKNRYLTPVKPPKSPKNRHLAGSRIQTRYLSPNKALPTKIRISEGIHYIACW